MVIANKKESELQPPTTKTSDVCYAPWEKRFSTKWLQVPYDPNLEGGKVNEYVVVKKAHELCQVGRIWADKGREYTYV